MARKANGKENAEKVARKVRCIDCKHFESYYTGRSGECTNPENAKYHKPSGYYTPSVNAIPPKTCKYFDAANSMVAVMSTALGIVRCVERMIKIEKRLQKESDGRKRRAMAEEYDELRDIIMAETGHINEHVKDLAAVLVAL